MSLDPLLHEPAPRPSTAPPALPGKVSRLRPEHGVVAVLAGTAALVAVVAVVIGPRSGADGGRLTAWPIAPAASPSTPTGRPTWPAVAPGPATMAPVTDPTSPVASPAGTTAGPASTPTGPGTGASGSATPTGALAGSAAHAAALDAQFCRRARSGADALGASGLRLLVSLAESPDPGSRVKQSVAASVQEAGELQTGAPGPVADAAATLASTWSRLSDDLDEQGYGRVSVVATAVKYLGSPAVALAVEALGQWATDSCPG